MTFVRGGHIYVVKMQYFFSSSCLHLGMDQTNLVHSNDDQESVYKNCKIPDPREGVLVPGHGHISHYSEYALPFILAI